MTKTATAPKVTKADQIALLLDRTDYTHSALQRMTLAALTALVEELPKPKTKRAKNRDKFITTEEPVTFDTIEEADAYLAEMEAKRVTADDHDCVDVIEPGPVEEGTTVRETRVRTFVEMDGALVGYFLTADTSAVRKALRTGKGLKVNRSKSFVEGLHDAWIRNDALEEVRSALAAL